MQQHSKLDTVDPKYQQTLIYGIICLITGEIYVGSTVQTLEERIAGHFKYGKCSAMQILDRGNYKAYVIQRWPCNTKREVLTLEGGWQRAYKASFPDHFVNKKIEGQFIYESPEAIRAYKTQPKSCAWCKQTISQGSRTRHMKHCKSNPEHVPRTGRKWTPEQKERTQVHNSQPWTCEWCDTTMRRNSSYRHKRRCKSKPTHTDLPWISKTTATTPWFQPFSSRRKKFMFYVSFYQIIFLTFRERYHKRE